LTLTEKLKLAATCFASGLGKRAKQMAAGGSKRIPRQAALQTRRPPAERKQLGANRAICIHPATMGGAATARLQRSTAPSSDVDNNAPAPSVAARADRDTRCLAGCFMRPGGLTFDTRGGWKQAKLAGRRPLDGRVRARIQGGHLADGRRLQLLYSAPIQWRVRPPRRKRDRETAPSR
jgi:hypothetical protein